MGTSVEVVDRVYGHLAQGAEQTGAGEAGRGYARRSGQEWATTGAGEAE
jgi:hypothetical protein